MGAAAAAGIAAGAEADNRLIGALLEEGYEGRRRALEAKSCGGWVSGVKCTGGCGAHCLLDV